LTGSETDTKRISTLQDFVLVPTHQRDVIYKVPNDRPKANAAIKRGVYNSQTISAQSTLMQEPTIQHDSVVKLGNDHQNSTFLYFDFVN
jgi:hypothetical protein